MRHSPERVADVACGVLGIRVDELWLHIPMKLGRIENARRRKLVAWCVRRISDASFPTIAKALMARRHSSIHTCLSNESATQCECVVLEACVRKLLQAFEPKPKAYVPPERDTRCDGVWFSPACREER